MIRGQARWKKKHKASVQSSPTVQRTSTEVVAAVTLSFQPSPAESGSTVGAPGQPTASAPKRAPTRTPRKQGNCQQPFPKYATHFN